MAQERYQSINLKNARDGQLFIKGECFPVENFTWTIDRNLETIPLIFAEMTAETGVANKQITVDFRLAQDKFVQTMRLAGVDVSGDLAATEEFEVIFENTSDNLILTWTGVKISNFSTSITRSGSTTNVTMQFDKFTIRG